MTALIIIGIIVALIVCFFMLRLTYIISYDEEFAVSAKILFIKIRLFPRKKKLKYKDYLPENIEKRKRKKEEKKRKKAEKKARKEKKKKEKAKPGSAAEEPEKSEGAPKKKSNIIDMVKDVLGEFFSHLPKYLRVEIKKLHATIGTEDAAKTAEVYGATMAALPCLLEFINEHAILVPYKKDSISLTPDFIGGEIKASIDIRLSTRIWQAVLIDVRTFFAYAKHKK